MYDLMLAFFVYFQEQGFSITLFFLHSLTHTVYQSLRVLTFFFLFGLELIVMSNLVPLQCRYVMSSSLNKDLTNNVMLQNFSVFMFFRLYFCLIKNCFSRMDSLSSFVYLRCLCAQLDEKNLLQCLHGSKAGTRTYVVKCTLYRVNTLIELIFSGV